ncbi:hypothetical protein HanXRQr2_Chr01g0022301 [Helianthus annuus]|uniref:Uncharacterized protein n=1 Tax=Helianthus annuus TaxID=4232 RepID=A0A9K3JVK3_HELAN|nr:hypothetical protein HanXRQr2_Chr01g0022301 [Helianthus annuus]KAJ0956953.1 hypothetical protein HanPSC8_Chr01g0021561 [Helianthus annuus]
MFNSNKKTSSIPVISYIFARLIDLKHLWYQLDHATKFTYLNIQL